MSVPQVEIVGGDTLPDCAIEALVAWAMNLPPDPPPPRPSHSEAKAMAESMPGHP